MAGRRFSALLLVVALVAVACGGGDTTGTADDGTPTTGASQSPVLPAGVSTNVEVTLESESAATGTIGPAGGTLTAAAADGTTFTLTIPERALLSPVEITMTPMARVSGEFADGLLGGVTLEPLGLHFLELVTVEITGDAVTAGSLGVSADGGQDLHLIPYDAQGGSLVLTTTHFSDFLAFAEQLAEAVNALVPVGIRARAEHELARGATVHALDALIVWVEHLANATATDLAAWESWTGEVISAFIRSGQAAQRLAWTEATPRFPEAIAAMQALLDRWFEASGDLVDQFADECANGDINGFFRIARVASISLYMASELGLPREEEIRAFAAAGDECLKLGITWQADVTATAGEFVSEISVGSESLPRADMSLQGFGLLDALDVESGTHKLDVESVVTDLEVEYIAGFWHGVCEGQPGRVSHGLGVEWEVPNLGDIGDARVTLVTVTVSVSDPVYIDCGPAGFDIEADAQYPFHGGALERLNAARVGPGGWVFELQPSPGGGVIAQLAQGPEYISGGEVNYELNQLLTVYQGG